MELHGMSNGIQKMEIIRGYFCLSPLQDVFFQLGISGIFKTGDQLGYHWNIPAGGWCNNHLEKNGKMFETTNQYIIYIILYHIISIWRFPKMRVPP